MGARVRLTRLAWARKLIYVSSNVDTVSVSIPRAMIRQLSALADDLLDRMHPLLERNTDGSLNATERLELETIVQMAQFAQILAMVSQEPARP